MKQVLKFTVHFERGYIADPYWLARDELINVQKASGVNRARSEANRRKALEEHLKRLGKDFQWYLDLEEAARKPFYTNGDGTIEIPQNQVYACFAHGCSEARAATRPCNPEQVRSRFVCSAWQTTKTREDGWFERFVTVTAGNKTKLSNQRGLRRNAYITDFDATGSIEFDPGFVKPPTLKEFLIWTGDNIGVGACRKMGWGKWTTKFL